MNPPGGLPMFAAPLIGFMQWHLSRGDDPDTVLERVRADERFAHFASPDLIVSLAVAESNVAAQNRANAGGVNQPLWMLLDPRFSNVNTVGVRVVMTVQFPDGHAETVSVTVNAGRDRTAADAIAEARRMVEVGNLGSRSGRAYPREIVGEPEVMIVAGGVQGPA